MRRSAWRLVLLWLALPVLAQTPAAEKKILDQVALAQKMDAPVPLDLSFHDATGRPVLLKRYFNDKPVILALVYFECPMLCTETLNGLTRAIRSLSFTLGKDYDILTVSINPRETPALAAAKKRVYVDRYGRHNDGQGWNFLTGDEKSIRSLADAVGFHYVYDPALDQYAHGTELIILSPQGRVTSYLYGVEYSAKELRLALRDASGGARRTPIDRLLLYCYHYDPVLGKYGPAILHVVRVAAVLTVIGLAVFIGVARRT